jgi:hypothetical protein
MPFIFKYILRNIYKLCYISMIKNLPAKSTHGNSFDNLGISYDKSPIIGENISKVNGRYRLRSQPVDATPLIIGRSGVRIPKAFPSVTGQALPKTLPVVMGQTLTPGLYALWVFMPGLWVHHFSYKSDSYSAWYYRLCWVDLFPGVH